MALDNSGGVQIKEQPTSTKNNMFGSYIGDVGSSVFGSLVGGYISEHFNKRSEQRADERNRKMLVDQPGLTAEGRRRAGLNPYGDATIPGMQGQSQTDTTSLLGTGAFSQVAIATKQLENDTLVAQSQANLNNAEADRVRGQEFRDVDLHPLQKELVELGVEEKKISNYVAAATADTTIAMSQQQLSNMYREGVLLIEDIYNTQMDTQEKAAKIKDIESQIMYREVQAELAKANINLTYAEVEQCFANINLMSAQELVALSEGALNEERANHIKSLTAGQDIENALNQKYGGAQRVVGMVTDSLNSISGVVSSVADVLPWNALKGKLANANKRASNAERYAESAYDRGYRSGRTDKWEKEERDKYGN